jgi:ERF superfamily
VSPVTHSEKVPPPQVSAAPPGVHKSIAAAVAAVMAEVTSVSKDDQFNGGQTRYAYRGVDRVVKALSAAVRRHGLLILPTAVSQPEYLPVTTAQGKAAFAVHLVVTYTITHTGNGEELRVQAPGESMDSGDKGTAKAMSVAWRTMLLQTFFLPTEEPDPDSENYELGTGAPQHIRGGGSPAVMQRMAEHDAKLEQALADWRQAIADAKDDPEALGKLYTDAIKRKLPQVIVNEIKTAGTAARAAHGG